MTTVSADPGAADLTPVAVRGAYLRGARGLIWFLLSIFLINVLLYLGVGDTDKAWYWVGLFVHPPSLARLQGSAALEANLDRLFQIIFVVSVLISVFFQQTISEYFSLNKLDFNNSLILKYPVLTVVDHFPWIRISMRPYGRSVKVEKLLKLNPIIFTLNLIACASIVAVYNFLFHVITAGLYLFIVLLLDVVTWVFLEDGQSSTRVLYRGIQSHRLFRYTNRQLVFIVDSGAMVILFIIALGLSGGYITNPTVVEKAFFTGVVSFYLISTSILIVYVLYEWGAILNRKSVFD